MAREQLGPAPSGSTDSATKGYVDGLSTATGKSIITAADAAAARAAIDFRSGTKEFRTHVDLRDWAAVRNANWKTFLGLSVWTGSQWGPNAVSAPSGPWTSADVGKILMVRLTKNPDSFWKTKITEVVSPTKALVDNPAPAGDIVNVRCYYGFDGTTAINSALAEVEASSTLETGGTPVDVYLGGQYRLTQLVIPEHVKLYGVQWHPQTTAAQASGRTILHQLPGAQKDFVVFSGTTDILGNTVVGYCGLHDIELLGPEIDVVGMSAATIGNGVAFRTPAGNEAPPIDTFTISNVHTYNFPESGFRMGGAVPLFFNECTSWRNGRYGFEISRYGGSSTCGLYITNFSGDWNNLGLIGIRNLWMDDNVMITGVKSEGTADSIYGTEDNNAEAKMALRGAPNYQSNCIVLENCDPTVVILINGVSHKRIYRAGIATGPLITIRDTTGQHRTPNVVFNGCSSVVDEARVGLPGISDSVMLRDESNGVDIPRSVHSGFYPSLMSPTITSPTVLDDAGKKLLVFASTTNAGNYIQIQNAFTGTPPKIAVVDQTSPNVALLLAPQGAAAVSIAGATVGGSPPTIIGGAGGGNYDLDVRSRGTGQVRVNGAEASRRTIQSLTTFTTLTAGGDFVVFLTTNTATPTLPAAAGNTGRYTIKNSATQLRPVFCGGSDTIEGLTSWNLAPGDSVDLFSDGTNTWKVV